MGITRCRRVAAMVAIALPVLLGWPAAAPAASAAPASAPRALAPQSVVSFTGLTIPYGVAVDGAGNVTATSYPDEATTIARVLRRTATTQSTPAFGDLGSPFGVALGSDGATYVTDASEGVVRRLPAGGGTVSTLPFTGLSFPTGIAVGADGSVYVADSGNARIVRLPAGGGAQSNLAFTGLENPYGVAVDGSGAVYVADLDADRIVKLTSGGTQSTLGFSGLESPDGIAVAADGTVIVADAGNNRVLQLPASGGSQVVLPFSGLNAPAGVAVRGDGSIYVADSGNNRVVALLDDTPRRTPNQSLVVAAYNDFIDRDPTPTELSQAAAALDAGGSRAAFLRTLSTSDVYLAAVVNRLYQDTLGRDGDESGVAYWTQELRSGRRTVAAAAASFYSSVEYFNGIGGGTNETWVRDLYVKILLRPADQAGVNHWVGVAQTRGRSRVSLPMFQSPESARTRVRGLYRHFLGRGTDASGLNHWAGQVVVRGDLALAVNLANSAEYYNRAAARFP